MSDDIVRDVEAAGSNPVTPTHRKLRNPEKGFGVFAFMLPPWLHRFSSFAKSFSAYSSTICRIIMI
jgi:hypothetical protein